MTAHDFARQPGGTLCVVCHCPGHCPNCDEGTRPQESHLYLNAATRRWTYGCVRAEPLRSDPPAPVEHAAVVHKVRPVKRRRS